MRFYYSSVGGFSGLEVRVGLWSVCLHNLSNIYLPISSLIVVLSSLVFVRRLGDSVNFLSVSSR